MRIETDDTHDGWEAQKGIRNGECEIMYEESAPASRHCEEERRSKLFNQ